MDLMQHDSFKQLCWKGNPQHLRNSFSRWLANIFFSGKVLRTNKWFEMY